MLKEEIRNRAIEMGFDACGFAAAAPLDDRKDFYFGFLREQRQANMAYLERYAPQRLNPDLLLPGVKTVVSVLVNYYPPELLPEEDNFVISKYAYGKRYPPFIKIKMEPLAAFIDSFDHAGGSSKIFVDSGPVLEKAWAQRCGIGWQGKNTLLINPKLGSYFFLGIILTTLEIDPDPGEQDHCGNCRKCMEACPTGALDRPYELDIRRCISYCTLVKNAEMIEEVRSKLGGRIYGCDTCQDVCPYNRFAKPTSHAHFHASEELKSLRRSDWMNLTETKFKTLFAGGSIEEKGYEKLMRNIHFATKG